MALLDLFDSGDKKKRLSHIKNLVALAASDGEIDKNEIDLILNIGAKIGLSHKELWRIIERPDSISFRAPNSFREKIQQLYDMVFVMMIDGKIHENEIALCKLTAIKLGFQHQIIDEMVLQIIDMIAKKLDPDYVLSDLEKQYK